jgi:PilZ domain
MGMGVSGRTSLLTERAPRFAIHTRLRYRARGGEQWNDGEMVNISRSGLLFRASQSLRVRTPLEMTFELPVELSEGPAATVNCQGVVVRTVQPAASDQSPELAATIRDYRLIHRSSTRDA